MFQNLIESGSHRRDLARRGRFLLGTLALYAALICGAGVASVYAYNARLDAQSYEVTILPPWVLPAQTQAAVHSDPPRGSRPNAGAVAVRRDLFLDLNTTPHTPPPVSSQASNVRPIPRGVPVAIGGFDGEPVDSGVAGPTGSAIVGGPAGFNSPSHAVVVRTEDPNPPEPVHPAPAATPRGPVALSHLISSKVVSKPAPPYPPIAIAAHVEGIVNVEVLVDERGRVVSATAKDGPLMLREAARQAALLARFTPTQLNGEPVKVSGVISYNFTLR